MRVRTVNPTDWLPNGLIATTLRQPKELLQVDKPWDVGAGLRPVPWFGNRQICVEPCKQYAERLSKAGFSVIEQTALDALENAEKIDSLIMLDVIEHMAKDEGRKVMALALEKVQTQIVVYTPLGFMPQDDDGWGLGEHHWQTHRSGWTPDEFDGFHCYTEGRGFFAIWTRTHN